MSPNCLFYFTGSPKPKDTQFTKRSHKKSRSRHRMFWTSVSAWKLTQFIKIFADQFSENGRTEPNRYDKRKLSLIPIWKQIWTGKDCMTAVILNISSVYPLNCPRPNKYQKQANLSVCLLSIQLSISHLNKLARRSVAALCVLLFDSWFLPV